MLSKLNQHRLNQIFKAIHIDKEKAQEIFIQVKHKNYSLKSPNLLHKNDLIRQVEN